MLGAEAPFLEVLTEQKCVGLMVSVSAVTCQIVF